MQIKNIVILIAGILLTANIYAQSAIRLQTKTRTKTKFNKAWKFELSDNPSYRNTDFDDSSWRKLNLPHDWSIEGEYSPDHPSAKRNGYFPEGIGWYRKSFSLGDSLNYKQLVIQFDGVFMNSEVWINGNFLGRYPYGYTTFQYDLTKFLKLDGTKNILAVRVDNSFPEATRWYNGSGIYRNVHLITTNFVHFNNYDGVFITTPVAEKEKAVVNVDYKAIGNLFSEKEIDQLRKNKWKRKQIPHNCIIRSIIFDSEGREVARVEENKELFNFDKHIAYIQKLEVPNPKRWSAEKPIMYFLKSEIEYNNRILDDQVTPFGIRKLEYIAHKGMFVNDKQVKLKGVCLHHDGGSVGAAVPDKIWYYRLNKFREMGCNAIRTAHNPFAPEFYSMCDTMGFYVMDEAFDEWRMGWEYNYTENNQGKAKNGYQLLFDQWAETDLAAMVRRDRNHPSVVMYSIGNEIPDQRDKLSGVQAEELVKVCHTNDPTRPVTAGNNQALNARTNGFTNALDISGYNYIARHHKDAMYLPEYKLSPKKLCIGSETTIDEKYFLAYRDNDYVLGQFIWVGWDYLGEVDEAPQRGWQRGLFDISGNKRPSFYQYESYWSDKPVVHICAAKDSAGGKLTSSWNWNKNDQMFLTVYSNCEEVELFQNGKSVGRKKVDPNKYITHWELNYKSGKLTAIGFNNNKHAVQNQLVSSGMPKEIVAHPLWSTIKANHEDITIIELSLIDKAGNLATEANSNIKVSIKGNAKLIGIDSGNLFYEGSFKANNRNATNGKLNVIIQAKDIPGEAEITFTSGGLKPTSVKINMVK